MTTFEQKVYEAVRAIPPGEVRTYKQIAKAAGNARAFRAVGNTLNKNRDFQNIPCHRVVRSDGGLGGYARGARKKRLLLAQEGVRI